MRLPATARNLKTAFGGNINLLYIMKWCYLLRFVNTLRLNWKIYLHIFIIHNFLWINITIRILKCKSINITLSMFPENIQMTEEGTKAIAFEMTRLLSRIFRVKRMALFKVVYQWFSPPPLTIYIVACSFAQFNCYVQKDLPSKSTCPQLQNSRSKMKHNKYMKFIFVNKKRCVKHIIM